MPGNVQFPTSSAQKVAAIWNSNHGVADEGSFYVANNPTIGTGIATTTSVVDDAATASATHAQNVPVMNMWNPSSNPRSMYLMYLKMKVTAAPTTATAWSFAFRADNVPRYTSGGTLLAPQNINTGATPSSSAQIYFGAVVTANLPSAQSRLLGAGQVQSSIPVVNDQWVFTFGDISMPTNILTASAAKNITIPCGPIILSPGWNLSLEMWGATNTGAPAWEFEFGYVERVSGQ